MSWLRIVTYRVPDSGPDAAAALEDVVTKIPEFLRILRQQAGFMAGHWGVDPEGGPVFVLTRWGSREDIEAANFVLKYLQQRAPFPAVQLLEEMTFEDGEPTA